MFGKIAVASPSRASSLSFLKHLVENLTLTKRNQDHVMIEKQKYKSFNSSGFNLAYIYLFLVSLKAVA